MILQSLALALVSGFSPQDREVVITNVNVIPMDEERVLENQTVVLREEIVEWVAPAGESPVPGKALVVDGTGLYLIPGLTDAHVHLRHEDELLLNLANGVTTVLNLSGTDFHLALRERIASGELRGPTVLTAGQTIDGDPPRNPIFRPLSNPEEAAELVRSQKEAGYDFLKIYDLITLDCYFAVVEAAQEHGLTIVGHIPKDFGLEPTLEGHRLIAHAEEFFYTFFENEPDESRIGEAAQLTAEAGVAVCPNIGFIHAILDQARDIDEVLARPEVRYVHPDALEDWLPDNNRYVGRPPEWLARNERIYPFLVKLTKGLHDAGVVLLSGTDASIPGGVPGFALHAELAELTDAGLTPYQALRTVTVNPGTWTHENLGSRLYGQVAPGHRADLLLLEANPLEDLDALRKIRGVAVRGEWIDHAELQAAIDELADRYAD